MAFRQHVGQPARPKVREEAVDGRVAQSVRFDIGNLACETGAPEKIAGRAHVDHRVETRGNARIARGCLGECCSQHRERRRAGKDREKQAVGAQRAARRDHCAGHVVDRVETACQYREVDPAFANVEPIFLDWHGAAVVGFFDLEAALAQAGGEGSATGVHDKRALELPLHGIEPVQYGLGDMAFEFLRSVAKIPVAAKAARGAVEDAGRGGHVAACGGAAGARQALAMLREAFAPVLAFALPPRCPACGCIVEADHRFCAACWLALDHLSGRGCVLCNLPVEGPEGTVCGPCLEHPPRHDGVRAAVAYCDIARGVALRLKYGRRTGLGATIAATVQRHVDCDGLLVPVPLHRWRLWGRGFNQAVVIAASLARSTGLSLDSHLLVRKRATTPLKGLSRKQRADALRGAFRTTRKLDGERVWLVDDVYTSGATANACAAALKRAGAGEVMVLAWARVIRED